MYAILDIETTGGKYNEEGITEIAIHKFDGKNVVDKFISLINPEREIQPFVVNLTGINTKMLRTAPKFHEVAKRIIEITGDSVLVAHNAQFDYRILRTEFRRLGYNFERKTLCTVDLSKKLLPNVESYSLGKLVRTLGIPMSERHRANGDAIATLKLFKLLLAKDTEKTIIKEVVREKTHGELSQRQLDIVGQMPSETGLYYMHDRKGEILFLGKSTNIKKRVNQHFTKSGDRARQLQKETKTITFEETGSELVALLKENGELLRNNPKYNSNSRKKRLQALYMVSDAEGYQRFEIGPYDKDRKYVTTFNSLLSAKRFLRKITEEFRLYLDLNDTEKEEVCAKSPKDNCPGQETPMDYNLRARKVWGKYSLFGKTILIIDKGREIGEYSAILIKNGIFQGLGYYDLNHQINNLDILESIITPMKGDVVTNHIIDSYLRQKRVKKIIDLKN
ncbi:MAG: exonuclease [Maribacter sp.]|nr:MAG: exonuclease [Maribacter sp.]